MNTPDDIARPWLASYKEGVPHTFSGSKYENLGAFLEDMFARHADRPAFSNFRRTLTYRDIAERARAFAAFLQNELGYKPGDRLALMMPNILQYPICLYGCMLAGVVAVNVNPLYTTRELEHQLNDSGVRGIVLAENFTRSVAGVRPQVPSLRDIIVTRYGDEMGAFWAPIVNFYVRHVAKLVPKYYLPGVIPFKKLLKIGRTLPFTRYDAKPDEMAMLQYTGGTTGVAKGAMLSHANLLANATQINLWIVGGNIGPGDVIITALPLYHIFCCTINSLGFSSCGVHSVLVTNPRDIKSFLTILRRHPPTMLTGAGKSCLRRLAGAHRQRHRRRLRPDRNLAAGLRQPHGHRYLQRHHWLPHARHRRYPARRQRRHRAAGRAGGNVGARAASDAGLLATPGRNPPRPARRLAENRRHRGDAPRWRAENRRSQKRHDSGVGI